MLYIVCVVECNNAFSVELLWIDGINQQQHHDGRIAGNITVYGSRIRRLYVVWCHWQNLGHSCVRWKQRELLFSSCQKTNHPSSKSIIRRKDRRTLRTRLTRTCVDLKLWLSVHRLQSERICWIKWVKKRTLRGGTERTERNGKKGRSFLYY